MNLNISVTVRARYTKFGKQVPVYHEQLLFICNFEYHACRLRKWIISLSLKMLSRKDL